MRKKGKKGEEGKKKEKKEKEEKERESTLVSIRLDLILFYITFFIQQVFIEHLRCQSTGGRANKIKSPHLCATSNRGRQLINCLILICNLLPGQDKFIKIQSKVRRSGVSRGFTEGVALLRMVKKVPSEEVSLQQSLE